MNRTGLGNGGQYFGALEKRPLDHPFRGSLRGDDGRRCRLMDMDGGYQHRLAASSEWRFHRDILLARGDVNAVVHAHPVYATAFAICGVEIPGRALYACRRRRPGDSLRALCHLWNRGII